MSLDSQQQENSNSKQCSAPESQNDANANQAATIRKKVLVIGANGQTGFRVVQQLVQQQQQPSSRVLFQPTAMIRDASQAAKFDSLDVPWIVGDLEHGGAPTVEQMQGMDAVLFAAGAGRTRTALQKVSIDYLGAVRSIVAAQSTTSVTRFLLLSGINTDMQGTRRSAKAQGKDLLGPLANWHRLKAQSEHYLKESHLHGRALNWTIVCPGRLVDDVDCNKDNVYQIKASLIHGEEDLKAHLTPQERQAAVRILPGSHDGKVERLCTSRDNTAATLVALLDPRWTQETSNKSITILNGVLSVEEALQRLG